MTKVLLAIVCHATGEASVHDGRFLRSFDPDAHGGRGSVLTTLAPERAIVFEDAGAALAFWKTQSAAVPLRDDGQPNRPLTAYTVELLPLADALPGRQA